MKLSRRTIFPIAYAVAALAAVGYWWMSRPSEAEHLAWAKAEARLKQADTEAGAALEQCIASIDGFIAGRKAGAQGFAEDVLGWGAKFRSIGSLYEQVAVGLWKAVTSDAQTVVPDRFLDYVEEQFASRVLDRDELRRAVESAVAAHTASLRRAEDRLLVDLQADVNVGDSPAGLTAARPDENVSRQLDDLAELAKAIANLDILASAGVWVASDKVGDVLSSALTREKAGFVERQVVGKYVDYKVGNAIGSAVEQAGYKPDRIIALRVEGALDRIRSLLIEGDPAARTPGLRQRLKRLHEERARARKEAIAELYPAAPKPLLPTFVRKAWAELEKNAGAYAPEAVRYAAAARQALYMLDQLVKESGVLQP